MTPLHWACERGHISMVETLLRFGADVNIDSKFGKTSLEIASDIGRPDIFEMLQNADQFRAPEHPPKSDPMTLAATQSILSDGLDDQISAMADPDVVQIKQERIEQGKIFKL
jgi:ankyrin repeat protein